MSKFKSITGLILIAILSTASVAACSPTISDKNTDSKETTEVKSLTKVNWYIQASWYNKKWNSEVTLLDKVVTEKTGVEVNLIIPPSDSDEKLIAMAASGDLPDIITISNWSGVREQMIDAGYFYPLNELAEKYSPELLNIVPDIMKIWNNRENGNWYGITNHFTAPEWLDEGERIENANGIIARKDIMDKLGIKPEDFETQDGTVEALKKVKEANLTFNGKKVYPFYLQWNDWNMSRMWGIPWETENGDWIDFKRHPKYLEMYQFLNRLWREGLLQEDNFTIWPGEKVQEGVAFAYLGDLASLEAPLGKVYNLDNDAVYVAVGPIHALDGAEPVYDQAGTGWMTTYITRNSKNAEQAIKLLTFLASEEGQRLSWFGVEGETYEQIGDKFRYTKEYLTMKKEDPEMAKTIYGITEFWPLVQPVYYKKHVDKDSLPEADKNYMKLVDYFSQYAVNTPETMGVEPKQGSPEAGIKQKIEEYWTKQIRSMVLADSAESVEKIYKETISYIDNIGYQRVYEASNAVFQAHKLKFGKEFSFPR
ncbi:extracellular solute-binding protein [Clostridium thermarum]|uniref:extracellular solute-binding protein n=1 Tax=Clostridium thermarum TaxID=1716543 RepID=UPI001120BFEE|nr:extracellular solute-binding protein [Clostridium thermarum]